jgi:HNH endonuclease/T5orf172 domain
MNRVKHDPLVYYALREGMVKIGTTTGLAQRMSQLDIDRVLAIEPGSEVVEARRHAQFAGLRVHHEWFRPCEDLISHTDVLRRLYGLPDFTKRTARGKLILTPEHRALLAMLPPLVIPVKPGTLERFVTGIRLDEDGPCRFRSLYSDKLTGYGGFTLNGRKIGAHKAAHLMFVGPVPEGWHVDHVRDRGCVNRDCVWWEHLEAVPARENLRRGDIWKPRAYCKWGHELTPDNLYWTGPDKKWRRCKICKDATDRARNRRLHPNAGKPRTHCPYGHPLSGENLYIQQSNGGRLCRICLRDRARHRYQRLHGLELT